MEIRSRLPTVLGELRSNRPFLRLLGGRVVTNAGDSLYYVASMWLVFELTGSPLYTGVAGFLVRAPSAVGFLTGPLVDRWPLRHVLVATQLVNGVVVLVVPVAAWTGNLSVWVVLAVLPLVTFVNRFVYPAQNAALPRLVDEDGLARANSLLSAAYQGADMVFNAVSGVLVAIVGAVALFVVDAVTFAVAMLLFVGIRVPPSGDADGTGAGADEATAADGAGADDTAETDDTAGTDDTAETDDGADGYLAELREGFAYVRGSLLVVLLVGVVVANFAVGAMLGVLPAFAATAGGPDAYGLLMAAYAGGTLVGTLVASRLDDYPLGRFATAGNVASGATLGFGLALGWFPATVALFFLSFVPVGAFNVLFFTMLQSAVADDLLGRVSSVVTSAATAAVPVGSAVGGVAAGLVGSRFVMYWWAGGTVVFGLYVASRPALRSLPPAPDLDASSLRLGVSGDDGESGSAAAVGADD